MNLSHRFAQLTEMLYQFLEIQFVLNAEAIPEVATDTDTAKTKFLCHSDVLDAHSAQCIYVLVYKPLVTCLFHFLNGQGCLHITVEAIKEGMETNIVTFLLHLLQVAYAIGAASDIALELSRRRRVWIINMDALEVKFLLEIVMLVHTNP